MSHSKNSSVAAMEVYEYAPLDSENAEIRILTIPFGLNRWLATGRDPPLSGRLTHYKLPSAQFSSTTRLLRGIRLPAFTALSYVWGDPARTHKIIIDGKSLPITASLYAALRQLQVQSTFDVRVWADAICINQEDLAERSAQVQLMRQIYHNAGEVRIWLGSGTEESWRCMSFIADLTSTRNYTSSIYRPKSKKDSTEGRDGDTIAGVEKMKFAQRARLWTSLIYLRAKIRWYDGLGDIFYLLGNIWFDPSKDETAEPISAADKGLSLYQEAIEALLNWRPKTEALETLQPEGDFTEIAGLIDEIVIHKSDWFGRMWVVQEASVARFLFLQFGECLVAWSHFLQTIYYLHSTCKIPTRNFRRVIGIEKIRIGWQDGKRQALLDLILECHYRQSSDPRDKVYAVLGLMGDRMNDLLQPDYSKSISEVYTNVTRHFITQYESLDPICGQQLRGRQQGLPSWVLDFSLDQDLAASPLVGVIGEQSPFSASGRDERGKYTFGDASPTPHLGTDLQIYGLCIGAVGSRSEVGRKDESFGSLEKKWLSTLVQARDFKPDTITSLTELSELISQYSEYWHSEDRAAFLLNGIAETRSINRERSMNERRNIIVAYLQTLLCGRFRPQTRLMEDHIEMILNGQHPVSKSTPESPQHDLLAKICSAFESGMRGRTFILTRNGRMGACPETTQVGDRVCVLFGCSVPVILRKVHVEKAYKFVGECYLSGFMDGEAIAKLDEGKFKEEEFLLI